MKLFVLTLVLALFPMATVAEFICPNETQPACLEAGDKVCPGESRCIGTGAVCFEDYPCPQGEGFVCSSSYDKVLKDSKEISIQYDELTAENVALREERLKIRSCVVNAGSLKEAIRCVRK